MLTDEALQEFKKIYREEFGAEITDEEAMELGVNLLTMFDAVYRPVKKEWLEEIIKKENENK